jgi:hypothetical protein
MKPPELVPADPCKSDQKRHDPEYNKVMLQFGSFITQFFWPITLHFFILIALHTRLCQMKCPKTSRITAWSGMQPGKGFQELLHSEGKRGKRNTFSN